MVCQNGVLNQFYHSLFIEIPSRDSLLARTEINTQGRQEAAVGAVSAVSACHSETVLDNTGYRCRPPGRQGLCGCCKPQSHGPSLRQREVGAAGARGRSDPRAGARASRESCSDEASGQACCQSARAIHSPERADNPLAGARGHLLERADTPHESCSWGHAEKQTIAFTGA
jgi:hypothetical protein